ncbi:hypothetical protein TcasGA2_TC034914, partial [Tribolium castaneum]
MHSQHMRRLHIVQQESLRFSYCLAGIWICPYDEIFKPIQVRYDTDINYVSEFVQRMKIAHRNAIANIEKSTQRVHDQFNRKEAPHSLQDGRPRSVVEMRSSDNDRFNIKAGVARKKGGGNFILKDVPFFPGRGRARGPQNNQEPGHHKRRHRSSQRGARKNKGRLKPQDPPKRLGGTGTGKPGVDPSYRRWSVACLLKTVIAARIQQPLLSAAGMNINSNPKEGEPTTITEGRESRARNISTTTTEEVSGRRANTGREAYMGIGNSSQSFDAGDRFLLLDVSGSWSSPKSTQGELPKTPKRSLKTESPKKEEGRNLGYDTVSVFSSPEEITDERQPKRKREDTPKSTAQQAGTNDEWKKLCKAVEATHREMERLTSEVSKNPNTKREINKSITVLKGLLHRVTVDNLGKLLKDNQTDTYVGDDIKSEKSLQSNETGTQTEPSMVTIGTQTEDEPSCACQRDIALIRRWEDQNTEEIRQAIDQQVTGPELENLFSRSWPEKAYTTTSTKSGSLFSSSTDSDLVIIGDTKDLTNKSVFRKVASRVPHLLALAKENKIKPGKVVHISCQSEIQVEGDDLEKEHLGQNKRSTFLATVEESTPSYLEAATNLNKASMKASSKLLAVAILVDDPKSRENIRKALEYSLKDLKATIYIPEDPTKNRSSRRTANHERVAQEGIILTANEGKTYADLLKEVKSGLSKSQQEDNVIGCRQTREGNLLLRIRPNSKAATKIKEELANIQSAQRIRVVGQPTQNTLLIRGLDALATNDDVEKAIERSGISLEDTHIQLRPAWGNTKTAIIQSTKVTADALVQSKELRIGLTLCQIRPRQPENKCFRCWETGHRADTCKGPDRSKLCLKCGKNDHKAAECKNEMFCPICNLNANRSRRAHDILHKTASETNSDIVLLSEPNLKVVDNPRYLHDIRKDTAINILSKHVQLKCSGSGSGFTWISTSVVTVYSCYISPNSTIGEFINVLESLTTSMQTQSDPVIVTGDFNAKSTEWGMPYSDRRGSLLADWIAQHDLTAVNKHDEYTFQRGRAQSIIDLTLVPTYLVHKLSNWRTLDAESLSDHKYIAFTWDDNAGTTCQTSGYTGWNLKRLDKDKLLSKLREATCESTPASLNKILQRACNAAMPKKRCFRNRRPVYWWNEKIANLRKNALKFRRTITRLRSKRQVSVMLIDGTTSKLKQAQKMLRDEIQKAKSEKWKELCLSLEDDLWGNGYQTVMKRTGQACPFKLPREQLNNIVAILFPLHADVDWIKENCKPIPDFTHDELRDAARRLKSGKAPGPDGVPGEIIKIMVEERPDTLLEIFNRCAKDSTFPDCWKIARLILLPKPGKLNRTANAFRPICILDASGKLYEYLLYKRLDDEIEQRGGLSPFQFGFRKGVSTVHAIDEVIRTAEQEKLPSYRHRKTCLMITFDVQNAFNSASWQIILEELKQKGISPSLINTIRDYLNNRKIITDYGDTVKVNSGVPQGSVLAALLWNVMYDSVLRIATSENVKLIGYADDLAVIITCKQIDGLEETANHVVAQIADWMETKRLKLAPEKTECILLRCKRKPPAVKINVLGTEISPKSSIKYLGVWIDQNCGFKQHIQQTAIKVEKTITALSSVMPNIGGPSSSKRRMLSSVAHSAMLYGAPIWHNAMTIESYKKILFSLQRRLAIRIASAYRTAPTDAIMVISGIPPVHLQATERKDIFYGMSRSDARDKLINKWQREWTGRKCWTSKLIPDLRVWLQRDHGTLNYYLTQFLTGHGNFRSYLSGIQRCPDDECIYCGKRDSAEHILYCPRWKDFRDDVGVHLSRENIIGVMLESPENWAKISGLLTEILKQKDKEELGERCAIMAFADDLILIADRDQDVPAMFDDVSTFLERRGMSVNPAKCRALIAGAVSGRSVVRTGSSYNIHNTPIPNVDALDAFKYLGLEFGHNGVERPTIHNLSVWLNNLRRAPLKPDQKCLFIRQYVIPRLLYGMQNPQVTSRVLREADRLIRRHLKTYCHLNVHTPDSLIHASVSDGGLGIMELRKAIPRIFLGRLVKLLNKNKNSYLSSVLQSNRVRTLMGKLSTMAGEVPESTFWRNQIASGPLSKSLEQRAKDSASRLWISEKPSGWSGRDHVRAVQLRTGNLPTKAIPSVP